MFLHIICMFNNIESKLSYRILYAKYFIDISLRTLTFNIVEQAVCVYNCRYILSLSAYAWWCMCDFTYALPTLIIRTVALKYFFIPEIHTHTSINVWNISTKQL